MISLIALVLCSFVAVNEAAPAAGQIETRVPIRWEWIFDSASQKASDAGPRSKTLTCPSGQVIKIVSATYEPKLITPDCTNAAKKKGDTERLTKVCNGWPSCTASADLKQDDPKCSGWTYITLHTCVPEGSVTTARPAILRG